METIQPLLDLLGGQHGTLAAICAWVASVRFAMKPFNTAMLGMFSRAVIYVHNTPEKDDDALLLRLLGAWPYRLLAFLVDTICSVKLPTAASIRNEMDNPTPPGGAKFLLFLLTVGMLPLTGCLGPRPLAPGADPVVVNAESTIKASFKVVNAFLKFEYQNQLELEIKAPTVRLVADELRAQAPDAFREAWKLIDIYKASKTAVARSDLDAGLSILQELVDVAERQLAKAKGAL